MRSNRLRELTIPERKTVLHLDRRLRPDQEPKYLARKLVAHNRAVPILGREGELQSLVDWLVSEPPVAVRVVHGVAGIGKTRLGVELCERARGVGWQAGFARA